MLLHTLYIRVEKYFNSFLQAVVKAMVEAMNESSVEEQPIQSSIPADLAGPPGYVLKK